MSSRVAVVGTVVDDEIVRPDRQTCRSLGGIAYTVGALASLAGQRLDIVPVCRVGHDMRERLLAHWLDLPGVRLDRLLLSQAPHTRVRLDYGVPGLPAGERLERLLDPLPPIDAADLAGLGKLDVALVNCISGFDLTVEAMEALAGRSRVYLDLHSLALSRHDDGTRAPRAVPQAERWLAGADWLQCNRQEAAALTAGEPTAATIAEWLRAARRPRAALLTLGADGALLVRPDGVATHVPTSDRSGSPDGFDPTGAGDTFGAAFVAAVLEGSSDEEAAGCAVRAATAACAIDGVEGLRRLAAAVRCC